MSPIFLQCLSELSEENRAAFFYFWTGARTLPLGGFGALEPRLLVSMAYHTAAENVDKRHPVARTCLRSLSFPRYSSIEVMRAMLLEVVTYYPGLTFQVLWYCLATVVLDAIPWYRGFLMLFRSLDTTITLDVIRWLGFIWLLLVVRAMLLEVVIYYPGLTFQLLWYCLATVVLNTIPWYRDSWCYSGLSILQLLLILYGD